jgi:hypothetical protein
MRRHDFARCCGGIGQYGSGCVDGQVGTLGLPMNICSA